MITMMRKLRLLVLLLVVTSLTQNAAAILMPMLESSYYDGFVFYMEGDLRGRIDFAVYDTEHPEYGDEYVDVGITHPGEGQYIYAYQIFNDYFVSYESVAYFAALGVESDVVDAIDAQEDPETGIAPGDTYLDVDNTKAVWEFNGDDAYVYAGEHSWYLIFSSDQDWVKGDYEIRGPAAFPVPEPATVVLLGLGSAMILARRRKAAQ